ncbi:helix-turn-helix domain-containing protein [Geobacillus thermodenitrificans]|uniref:helix-turn-helix domain-containing protein n=1 Tax=Geobacillus thermodenitrificans TaxID=33940 RepID=UPI000C283C91|nr:helix-turn-helix domain-containing protein [Geobacillus thermodenitrificans]PJW21993.1 helix-turn-helix domain-containing protein [Geobacillus thermodenitrificans]
MRLSNANYTQYKELQSFDCVQAMNHAIRRFLYTYGHELSESAVEVLKILSRYACDIVGVAFPKVETIAALVGKSVRTVQRALKTLEEYGIIKRIPTIRTNGKHKGGNGHNVYVIQPVENVKELPSDMPPVTPAMSPRQEASNADVSSDQVAQKLAETMPCETAHSRLNKKDDITSAPTLDESFTPGIVPEEFVNTVAPFFRSADAIFELYRRVLIAYRRSKLDKPLEDVIGTVIKAFKQTVFAQKRGRIRATFHGYFYRILEAMLAVERRREVGKLYDFLVL